MTSTYDVVVIGAGAMGSAAAWALAERGRDVVVCEQFELGHVRGGSHGATRIFRVGSEQAEKVELALQAHRLWRELEEESGEALLRVTGAVEHGLEPSTARAMSSLLDRWNIDHEVFDPAEATRRWPTMRFADTVLYQPGGGAIDADRAGAALRRLAVSRGARILAGQAARRIQILDDARVRVELESGSVEAQAAVVTAGPWTPRLLAGLVDLPTITVTQEQPRFFAPVDATRSWPSFVHWRRETGRWGRHESYGLFEPGSGVKVGLHRSGSVVDPDERDFAVDPEVDEALVAYVRHWFPGLDADRSTAISCLYDNTETEEFVIDRLGPVTFATGFNGEGFKFVPAIGRLVRDLVIDRVITPSRFSVAGHAGALTSRSR